MFPSGRVVHINRRARRCTYHPYGVSSYSDSTTTNILPLRVAVRPFQPLLGNDPSLPIVILLTRAPSRSTARFSSSFACVSVSHALKPLLSIITFKTGARSPRLSKELPGL